jgi:hypothetical protein
LWRGFQSYLATFGSSDAEEQTNSPGEAAPQYITGWIWRKCESPDPQNPKTRVCQGASFSHALKMRAAVSYHYAQQTGRGSEKWHQDTSGGWIGNPALSHHVSRYMISLQRRKVQTIMHLELLAALKRLRSIISRHRHDESC